MRASILGVFVVVGAAAAVWGALREDAVDERARPETVAASPPTTRPAARRRVLAEPVDVETLPEPTSASRRVEIVDAETGRPIPFASVATAGCWDSFGKRDHTHAIADELGVAVVEDADGEVASLVAAQGYARRIFDGVPTRIALRRGRTVSGIVTDAETGLPLCAHVTVYDEDDIGEVGDSDRSFRWGDAWSGEVGRFEIDAGDVGLIRIHAHALDHESVEVTVDEKEIGTPVSLALAPTGVIRGVVRDPAGNPFQFATVHSSPEKGGADPEAIYEFHGEMTDEEGRYEIEGVSLGCPYRLWTESEWCGDERYAPAVPATGVVVPADSRVGERDFVLRTPPTLVVTVRDPEGVVVLPARVAVTVDDADAPGETTIDIREAHDGGDHEFHTFGVLPPGHATISVSAPGLLPSICEVELVAGVRRDVGVTLSRGVAITGRVVDDLGRPLAAVRVESDDPEAPRGRLPDCTSTTADDGSFVVWAPTGSSRHVTSTAEHHLPGDGGLVRAPASDLRIVCGRVATVTGAVPPSDARDVTVRWDWRDAVGATLTSGFEFPDADGAWRFEFELPPGEGTLHLEADDAHPLDRRLVTQPGATLDFGLLEFPAGSTVDVSVLDAEGRTTPGARIVVQQPGISARVAEADVEGHARLRGLDEGRAVVTGSASGFAPRVVEVPSVGAAKDIDIVLDPGVELRVRVRAAEPYGLPVDVTPADGSPSPERTSSLSADGNGACSTWLAPGRYVVRCGDASADVELVQERPVRIVLDVTTAPSNPR